MADDYKMGTYHLADHPELYEPSRNNAFEFQVTGLEELLPAGLREELAEADDYLTDVQNVIRLSLNSVNVPHFTVEPISIKRGNSTMKFAGTPSFEAGSISFNDYVGARTKDVLLAWQALTYDVVKDVVNVASKYKHDCFLVEFAPDYSRVVRKWTLKGCWISDISEDDFTHDSNDKRKINVKFQYDRAIPEIVKE